MSNRIKVRNEVDIYEENGENTALDKGEPLIVESHWNCRDRIVLSRGKINITVIANDLKAAIQNATNAN